MMMATLKPEITGKHCERLGKKRKRKYKPA